MMDAFEDFDPVNWRVTPCTAGRVATDDDVENGRAVFCLEGQSEPASLTVPSCAFQLTHTGEEVPVVVIQAESTNGSVLLGVRYLFGGFGICPIEEARLLPEGWPPGYEF